MIQESAVRAALKAGCCLLLSATLASCSDSGTISESTPLLNRVYFDSGLTVQAGEKFKVRLYVDNSVRITGIAVPLMYSGDHVRCDSVSFVNSRVVGWEIREQHVDSVEQWISIGVVDPASVGVDKGRGLLATLFFWAYGNTPTADMVVDTFRIPPGAQLRFQDSSALSAKSFVPSFTPALVHIEAFP